MDAAILGLVGLGGLYAINNQEKLITSNGRKYTTGSIPAPTNINTTSLESGNNHYSSAARATEKYEAQSDFKKKYSSIFLNHQKEILLITIWSLFLVVK